MHQGEKRAAEAQRSSPTSPPASRCVAKESRIRKQTNTSSVLKTHLRLPISPSPDISPSLPAPEPRPLPQPLRRRPEQLRRGQIVQAQNGA